MHNGLNPAGGPCPAPHAPTPPVRTRRPREPVLLLAAVLALAWLLFSGWTVADRIAGVPTDRSTDALVAQLGAAVEVVMIVPYFVAAVLAVILSWLGWWLSRRGLALTAAGLLCLATLLGLRNGVGLLPGVVLEFIGASRLKRRKSGRP